MKTAEDTLIRRAAEAIVIISSLIIISLMITGGCDGTATSNQIPTPTPTNAPSTGFPPDCDTGVSLSCPATDLVGAYCVPYTCDIIDDGTEPPVTTETFSVNFNRDCADIDCFTLECPDLPIGGRLETLIFTVETVDDVPVGEDVEDVFDLGFPKGSVIINDQEFLLDCRVTAIP